MAGYRICIVCILLLVSCGKDESVFSDGTNTESEQIEVIDVFSQKMHRNIKVTVIKPDGYTVRMRYPVIYLLNCAGESNDMWLKYMPEIVELANSSGFIFVCPDGGTRSWYIDSPIDPDSQYESFIIDDVIPIIDTKYSVIKHRNGRFITGISMGGHGALYLAIRNKHLFAGCGSMIGGVDLCYEPDKFGIDLILGDYQINSELWKENSVITLVERLKDGELGILFDSCPNDFFYPDNVRLSEKLSILGVKHDFCVRGGVHDVYYIRQALPYHIIFFMGMYTKIN